jgi:hypothetical protein
VNTEKAKCDNINLECPHCLVCSIGLSAEEAALITDGQQMVLVCQVCGKEVYLPYAKNT